MEQVAHNASPSPDTFDQVAQLFKALGDPTRLRILYALLGQERSVGDIAAAVHMSTSAVSHQLSYLRTMRLVRHRREGRAVFYALDDDHVRSLFTQGLEHASHD